MRYYITEDLMFCDDTGEYVSYGIELRKGNRVIKRIRDIDVRRECVAELCELCNKLRLSEIHFEDVVDDYLAK